MSYLADYRRGYRATGSILDTAGQALEAAGKVIEDPALPEVTRIVLRLNATTKGGAGGKLPARGIGLSSAVTPLRGFLYYRENPWVVPVGLIAILGAPFYMGYLFGKKRKKA
jgi:hypothetical protein